MKKFLSLLLFAVIILSGFTFAFADDPEVYPSGSDTKVTYPDSALLSTVTDENVIEYDNLIREAAYQTALRSSGQYDYDAGDIYNLLWQTLVGNGNYYLKVYDNNTYNLYNSLITGGLISDILTSLHTIEGYNTYTDGIVQYTTASLLHTIASNINTNNTSLSYGLFDYNNNPYLGLIYTNLETFETLFDSYATNSLNHLNTIDLKVNYIEQYSSYLAEATEQSIVPNVAHIDSDLHDIKQWLEDTFYLESTIIDDIQIASEYFSSTNNILKSYPYISNINASIQYAYQALFNDSVGYDFDILIESDKPFGVMQNSSGVFWLTGTNRYEVDNSLNVTYLQQITLDYNFIDDYHYSIHVILPDNFFESYNYQHYFLYFTQKIGKVPVSYPATIKAYFIYESTITNRINLIEHIDNDIHLGYDILSTFKELYASDDLIQAKENQQQYEDQVIEDFTGSGSAAAKASDAASAKDISSAVSSGLNSGGSVNNSLRVFNTDSGFWGWFSQENSDLINTLSYQNRLRFSGSGSDWVLDDPYQRNAEELQYILGGNR